MRQHDLANVDAVEIFLNQEEMFSCLEDIERLSDALSRATRKNVEVKVVVDPDVMGGIVTKMGDLIIDGSVRHRLDQLREQI